MEDGCKLQCAPAPSTSGPGCLWPSRPQADRKICAFAALPLAAHRKTGSEVAKDRPSSVGASRVDASRAVCAKYDASRRASPVGPTDAEADVIAHSTTNSRSHDSVSLSRGLTEITGRGEHTSNKIMCENSCNTPE